MLVICFGKNRLLGGYGDRIVGLIAVQVMAAALGQEFRILWDKEDVTPFFEYAGFDNNEDTVENYLIDQQLRIKDYLMTCPQPFKDPITKFYLNQEISQYLFKNPAFANKNYFDAIFAAYKTLYTTPLKPTDQLLQKASLGDCKTPLIGIQIRCGDCFMATNQGECHNTGARYHINTYLTRIKRSLAARYPVYTVFVTSDFADILKETQRVFDNVLYIDDVIQHIDRPAINEDISKVFADNYILSQKTTELYISANSNYGRVAALSAAHDRIYDVATAQPLDKRRLLSKGECIFV